MTSQPVPDELVLIQRIIDRDQQALAALYAHYSRHVFNLALYILQNRGSAEEVTQDVFLLVWRAPARWNPEKGRFGSWLLSVTRNIAIDHLRKEQRRPHASAVSLETLADTTLADATRADTTLADATLAHALNHSSVSSSAEENAQLLRLLLRQIPREQVQVLLLAYYRGMTHEQIAAQLQIPAGTVKSRLRLGLEKLRVLWKAAVHEGSA